MSVTESITDRLVSKLRGQSASSNPATLAAGSVTDRLVSKMRTTAPPEPDAVSHDFGEDYGQQEPSTHVPAVPMTDEQRQAAFDAVRAQRANVGAGARGPLRVVGMPEQLSPQDRRIADVRQQMQQAGQEQAANMPDEGLRQAFVNRLGGSVAGGVAATEQGWRDFLRMMAGEGDPLAFLSGNMPPPSGPVTRAIAADEGAATRALGLTPEDQQAMAQNAATAEARHKVVSFAADLAGMPAGLLEPKAIASLVIAHRPTAAVLNAPATNAMLSAVESKLGPAVAGAVRAELGGAVGVGTFSGAHAALEGGDVGDVAKATMHGAALGAGLALPGAAAGLGKMAVSEIGAARAARAAADAEGFRDVSRRYSAQVRDPGYAPEHTTTMTPPTSREPTPEPQADAKLPRVESEAPRSAPQSDSQSPGRDLPPEEVARNTAEAASTTDSRTRASTPPGSNQSGRALEGDASAEGTPKEPWQMMRAEYAKDMAVKSYGNSPVRSKNEVADYERYWARMHRDRVQEALAEGKPVPPEVLADYPDLGKTRSEAEEPTPAIKPPDHSPDTGNKVESLAKEPWEMTREAFRIEGAAKIKEAAAASKAAMKRAKSLVRSTPGGVVSQLRPGERDVRVSEAIDADARARELSRTYSAYAHKVSVSRAIDEGKPVPPEVLADYPDLVKRANSTENAGRQGDGGGEPPNQPPAPVGSPPPSAESVTSERGAGGAENALVKEVHYLADTLRRIRSGELKDADPTAFRKSLRGKLEAAAANGETEAVTEAIAELRKLNKSEDKPLFSASNTVWKLADSAKAERAKRVEADERAMAVNEPVSQQTQKAKKRDPKMVQFAEKMGSVEKARSTADRMIAELDAKIARNIANVEETEKNKPKDPKGFTDWSRNLYNQKKAVAEENAALTKQRRMIVRQMRDVEAYFAEKARGEGAAPDVTEAPAMRGRAGKRGAGGDRRGAVLLPFSRRRPSAPVPKVSFTDPATEARWQEAKKGIGKLSPIDKLRGLAEDVIKKTTRGALPELPRTEEFGEARSAVQAMQSAKRVAADRTERDLHGIVQDLSPGEYDLFTRKVVLDDLTKTDGDLPFGFTKQTAAGDLAVVDAAVAKVPAVAKAIERRRRTWEAVKKDYLDSMKSVGADLSSRLNRDDYFRHQVLYYARLKQREAAGLGVGKRAQTPMNRGFLKKREGSELDINANYIEAEWEVMNQMHADAQIAKALARVKAKYDIAADVKADAKAQGVADWKTLIPKTHEEYALRPGRTMFSVFTIPENVASQAALTTAPSIQVPIDKVKTALAMGSEFPPIVVPREVARQLEQISVMDKPGPVSRVAKETLNWWKRMQLQAPQSILRYNLRNASEVDKVLSLNPTSLRYIPEAVDHLAKLYGRDERAPQSVRDWADRGGASLIQVNEIGDVPELQRLSRLIDRSRQKLGVSTVADLPRRLWSGYWEKAGVATNFRESILRYATYLDYLDQVGKGKGTPRNFGASTPEEITGILDPKDKAYRLSADLLGDYADVTPAGQWMRSHVVPFWSFQELNARTYIRGIRNLARDNGLAAATAKTLIPALAVRSPLLAMRLGRIALFVYGARALTQAFNHTMFPDEEKSLPPELQRQVHVVLGKDKSGKVRYFNRLGTSGDFLEWFGADAVDQDLLDVLNGRRTLKEVGADYLKSPINKVMQGIRPEAKMPFELAVKKTLYPDATKPRRLNADNDRLEYIADAWKLGDVYRWATGKPSDQRVSMAEKAAGAVLYRSDPDQAAYYRILDEKDRFRASKGLATGVDGADGARANALRMLKQSMRFKDENAAVRYLVEYVKWGGTGEGLQSSLKAMAPLHGLNHADLGEFYKGMREEDRQAVVAANRYYQDVLVGDRSQFSEVLRKARPALQQAAKERAQQSPTQASLQ